MTHRQSNGVEISGFIDYEESLRKTILEFDEGATDWYEIFKETKRIKPKKNDLGFVLAKIQCSFNAHYTDLARRYYNWNTGFSILNDTKNFKAISDPKQGLIFESKHDRCQILVDPLFKSTQYTRTVLRCNSYDLVVLIDHVVRGKI